MRRRAVADPRDPVGRRWAGIAALLVVLLVVLGASSPLTAAPGPPVPTAPTVSVPDRPTLPGRQQTEPDADATGDDAVTVELPDLTEGTPNSVLIILLITVIALVPSLLVLCTAFTRIVIVLSLTRSALGVPTLPPQQVIVGLSLFLTVFVMGPTLSQVNDEGLQPLLAGEITTSEAFEEAQGPLREFMLEHTGESELDLFVGASGDERPASADDVELTTLIPAFVLSEIKTGFLIGFCIFIPFLVIDLVVSAVLMALGMMMLPPSFVSLPFKLLLFVMIDGWALVVGTLLRSYG